MGGPDGGGKDSESCSMCPGRDMGKKHGKKFDVHGGQIQQKGEVAGFTKNPVRRLLVSRGKAWRRLAQSGRGKLWRASYGEQFQRKWGPKGGLL